MSYFEQRRGRVRRTFRKAGIDGLLVTNFVNVTYLTGFTGDDSYLLVTGDGAVLISDSRYETQLAEECPGLDVEIRTAKTPMFDTLARAVKQMGIRRIGVEGESMSLGQFRRLEKKLPALQSRTTTNLVETLRQIKDRQEIERIRVAADQARRAFEVIRSSLTPDQTEKQVAAELENQLRRFGAKGCSFPPIIATGARAALPHATPTDQRVGSADFTLIDWGSNEGLYLSDLTRMVVTGKLSTKLESIYRVVLKAQAAGIAAIRPGALCREVDEAARGVIVAARHGRHFGHGLGHGVGLEIHESPRLAPKDETILKPGMVITVEPGIYLPGWGGVRIEDDVLVTRDGHEVLTSVPKQLEDTLVG